MYANEYQILAARTSNPKLSAEERKIYNSLKIAEEAGEICGIRGKAYGQGHKDDREKAKEELGDLCWHIADLCRAYDLTFDEVLEGNIAKLRGRYPEGFSEERSRNREDPLSHVSAKLRTGACKRCAHPLHSPGCHARAKQELSGEVDSCFEPWKYEPKEEA